MKSTKNNPIAYFESVYNSRGLELIWQTEVIQLLRYHVSPVLKIDLNELSYDFNRTVEKTNDPNCIIDIKKYLVTRETIIDPINLEYGKEVFDFKKHAKSSFFKKEIAITILPSKDKRH